MQSKKFIDVDKVIQDKAPTLKKWFPKFVFSWLKRKLHEDEINAIMADLKDYYGLEFNEKGLEKFGAIIESIHLENIPKSGGIIIAANHPLGGLDGMALIKAVGDVRKDVRFLVNDVLKNLKNYGDVFLGVNKIRNTSATSLRNMEDVLISKDAVIFFPAGLVSRKQNGEIVDLEWKKSFVTQAIDHKRLIVPTYIEGQNSKFFYRFANLRKRVGIKANIEMLFLPDEMFKQKGQRIRIHFGKPFEASLLDTSKSDYDWAQFIKQYVYSTDFLNGTSFEEYKNKNAV
jgi:putative hemolysin